MFRSEISLFSMILIRKDESSTDFCLNMNFVNLVCGHGHIKFLPAFDMRIACIITRVIAFLFAEEPIITPVSLSHTLSLSLSLS